MSIDIGILTDELKRDEGFMGCAYRCTADKITVGYGHNIQDNPIPEYIAEKLLQYDIGAAINDCERLYWFYDLSDVRKRVIINMVFNLGANGVAKFENMIDAINQGDYKKAANEMRNSRWYRQVTARAERLAVMMETDNA